MNMASTSHAIALAISALEERKEKEKELHEGGGAGEGERGGKRDLERDFKKLAKRGYRCPGEKRCGNLLCDHRRVARWVDEGAG